MKRERMPDEALNESINEFLAQVPKMKHAGSAIRIIFSIFDGIVGALSVWVANLNRNTFDEVGRIVLYHAYLETCLDKYILGKAPGIPLQHLTSLNFSSKIKLLGSIGESSDVVNLVKCATEIRNGAVHDIGRNPRIRTEDFSALVRWSKAVAGEAMKPEFMETLNNQGAVKAYCTICLISGTVMSLMASVAAQKANGKEEPPQDIDSSEILKRINAIRDSEFAKAMFADSDIVLTDFDIVTVFKEIADQQSAQSKPPATTENSEQ